jgi:Ca-activated chloride channel family protein
MGRHRALAKRVRRGVAGWPIAVVGVVVVALLGWLGWTWVEGMADRQAAAQAQGCPEGDSVLRVAVARAAVEAVQQSATRWNEQKTVVYDHCVRIEVAALDSSRVFAGLTGEWNTETLGPRPQAWLPESSFWVNRLAAANNGLIGSSPESVASSPIVLAVPSEAVKPLTAGNSVTYGDLASLTSAPDGWARYGKPEWGRFTVAIPDPASNAASALALQCAIAGASPQRSGPVTPETLTLPAVQQNLAQLVAARPGNVPPSTAEALLSLASVGKVEGAPYSAVPVTEVDLYRRNLGMDGMPTAKPLYEVAARGPSPAADFPFTGLAGTGVDQTQIRAAQKFREFLKESDQQRAFNRVGLRAAGGAEYPHDAPGIRWDSATTSLVPADANTTQQIAATWTNTADGGQVVTVLVDVSRSMLDDGGEGRSRIDWVKQSLHGMTDRMATGSLGLWQFSRKLDGEKPYKRLALTGPVIEQRPALHAAVDALEPASGTHLYTSLDAAYRYALGSFVEGKHNRVVVITDGPNDGGMSYQQIRELLRELGGGKHKVPVGFIAIGPDPDRGQLTDLARATGGSVSELTDAKGVDAAIAQILSS